MKKASRPVVKSFRAIADELSLARGCPLGEVVEHFRVSIERAAVEVFSDRKVEASFVDDGIGLYWVLAVVDGPAQEGRELTLEAAQKIDPGVSAGDELMLQLHYLGTDDEVAGMNALTFAPDPVLTAMISRWRAAYPGVLDAARNAWL